MRRPQPTFTIQEVIEADRCGYCHIEEPLLDTVPEIRELRRQRAERKPPRPPDPGRFERMLWKKRRWEYDFAEATAETLNRPYSQPLPYNPEDRATGFRHVKPPDEPEGWRTY